MEFLEQCVIFPATSARPSLSRRVSDVKRDVESPELSPVYSWKLLEEHSPNLERLLISPYALEDNTADLCSILDCTWPSLKVLEVAGETSGLMDCWRHGDYSSGERMERFAQFLLRHDSLERVVLGEMHKTPGGAFERVAFPPLPHLRSLTCSYEVAATLLHGGKDTNSSDFPCLANLYIHSITASEHRLEHLLDRVTVAMPLASLTLNFTVRGVKMKRLAPVQTCVLELVARACPTISSLRIFGLTTRGGRETAEDFARPLADLPGLRHLVLPGVWLVAVFDKTWDMPALRDTVENLAEPAAAVARLGPRLETVGFAHPAMPVNVEEESIDTFRIARDGDDIVTFPVSLDPVFVRKFQMKAWHGLEFHRDDDFCPPPRRRREITAAEFCAASSFSELDDLQDEYWHSDSDRSWPEEGETEEDFEYARAHLFD